LTLFITSKYLSFVCVSERLQKTWRSPVYGFFKTDIKIDSDNGRPYHFFKCAAKRCKVKGGGIRCYQDSKDRGGTSNLKTHAIKCFGAHAVEAAFKKTSSDTRDGSIFASFARLGQGAVTVSHRAHSIDETRHIFLLMLWSMTNLSLSHLEPTSPGGALRAIGR